MFLEVNHRFLRYVVLLSEQPYVIKTCVVSSESNTHDKSPVADYAMT